MNKRKKNNIIPKKGNYYYRIRWYNEFGKQKETTIPLRTMNKSVALRKGKVVEKK